MHVVKWILDHLVKNYEIPGDNGQIKYVVLGKIRIISRPIIKPGLALTAGQYNNKKLPLRGKRDGQSIHQNGNYYVYILFFFLARA